MSYEATHRTFAYLHNCAARYLTVARYSHIRGEPFAKTGRPHLANRKDPKEAGEWELTGGTLYDCLSCLMFCALTVEAAVNHLAAEKVPYWDHFETKLKTKEKIALLSEVTQCPVDYGSMPFSEFVLLQRFRNSLAHGKTTTVSSPTASSMEEVSTDWMADCTIERAERGFKATRAMVEYLFLKILKEERPFSVLGHGSGTGLHS